MILTNLKSFDVGADPQFNVVVLNKNTQVWLTPGEADQATALVSIALGFRDSKVVPPLVTDRPFSIDFVKDGTLMLRRTDEVDGVIFDFTTGDDLIHAIRVGADKVIDEQRLRGGPRKGVSSLASPDIPLVGR